MNEKITLPSLIQLLAVNTGESKKQSEDFIKEFFGMISSILENGDQIKIKSLGVFKTVSVGARKSVNVSTGEELEIPSHSKVVFTPSKDIAARVNEPFEMFETVEINPDVDLSDDLDNKAKEKNKIETTEHKINNVAEEVPVPVLVPPLVIDNSEPKYEETKNADSEPIASKESEISNSPVDEDIEYEIDEETEILEKDNDFINSSEKDSSEEGDLLGATENLLISDNKNNNEQNREESNKLVTEGVISQNDSEEEQSSKNTENPRKFGIGFLTGFLSAVAVCAVLFIIFYFTGLIPPMIKTDQIVENPTDIKETNNHASDETVITPSETNIESIEKEVDSNLPKKSDNEVVNIKEENKLDNASNPSVPTQPSDEIVYDMITKTRYLTTMAKDHYGNYHLWPYIYIENKKFLGHPDRIKPGTKIVIPPLSKYGVNPKNKNDIEIAKKKGVEIYSRYK